MIHVILKAKQIYIPTSIKRKAYYRFDPRERREVGKEGIKVQASELSSSSFEGSENIEWLAERSKKAKTEANKNPAAKLVLNVLTDGDTNKTVVIGLDDPDINLIAKGRQFLTHSRIFKKMEPNRCHQNASRLYAEGRINSIGTGFALSRDGGWRPHSWGIKSGKIIETTYPNFIKYFGAELNGEKAEAFCKSNLPEVK